MKQLNGTELASYIKVRQAKEVRVLKSVQKLTPRLAIIQAKDDPVIDTYVRLKKSYGADIGVNVDLYKISQAEVGEKITELNNDKSFHGIIIQLPLADTSQTDKLVNLVNSKKDVDALGKSADFDPATPIAIQWLLAGYNISLAGKKLLIIGAGRLVGLPLAKLWQTSGHDVTVVDSQVINLESEVQASDVVVTATGQPGLVTSQMLKAGSVVVDAGVAAEHGKTLGDLADDVYKRQDLILTPKKGGVGPLTVSALFENVIKAARLQENKEK